MSSLPPGWESAYDPSSGRTYCKCACVYPGTYWPTMTILTHLCALDFNRSNNQRQWDPPAQTQPAPQTQVAAQPAGAPVVVPAGGADKWTKTASNNTPNFRQGVYKPVPMDYLDIFDCCQNTDTCLAAYFCTPCAVAQVGEKLDILGGCQKLAVIQAVVLGIYFILAIVFFATLDPGVNVVQNIIWWFFYLFWFWFVFQSRNTVRRAYGIQDDGLMDCLCAFFCLPCGLSEVMNAIESKEQGLFGTPQRKWSSPQDSQCS